VAKSNDSLAARPAIIMKTRTKALAFLALVAALRSATAQELVVIVESPAFTLDTRLASGSDTAVLVVTAASPPFTLDTRLSVESALSALVVTAESLAFTLDTRLSSGSTHSAFVVTAESPGFTLDTRLAGGNSTLAALVVTAESAAFALDTRLAGRIDALIVQAVSPAFTLNTMWVGIRTTAPVAGSLIELYWPTNAPGFRLQLADPPLGPSALWLDVPNSVSESGGLYRVLLNPAGSDHYFRLKL
jgi:hypothetical protein